MRYPSSWACLSMSLLIQSAAAAVDMDWTLVGDPNDVCDVQFDGSCHGAVAYPYNIGTYEVTNAQYAEFLNAKAASDPLQLYNAVEHGNLYGGIARTGSPGSYSYSVIPGRGDVPVSFLSFYDALRFANWMNNGQGSADTETGAYTLLGGTPTPSNGNSVTRNAGATIALTNEDEWHKAAYYVPLSETYIDYPTNSNTPPTCTESTGTPNEANCHFVVGDFTAKGSYATSASPYGTFDQGGNAFEWNETLFVFYGPEGEGPGYSRGLRGGDWGSATSYQKGWFRGAGNPVWKDRASGFRLVELPEPSTGTLLVAGALAVAGLRRARA